MHLIDYYLEYSTDQALGNAAWRRIQLPAVSSVEDKVLFDRLLTDPPTTLPIDLDWPLPTELAGKSIHFRLSSTDKAGNHQQQVIQVEVPDSVKSTPGGSLASIDQRLQLYIPPRSLSKDTIVTINSIDKPAATDSMKLVHLYEIEPETVIFDARKPATLQFSYDQLSIPLGQRLAFFKFNQQEQRWALVGGMLNPNEETLTTTIQSLGRYAVMEVENSVASNSSRILTQTLTCQPRVFSPRGNGFRSTTTISFELNEAATGTIKIYNVAGNLVQLMVYEHLFARGRNAIDWDGRDHQGEIVLTGLYIVTVTINGQTETKVVNVFG
jgi:hypothetical protein